jgi:manganese transport protein
LITPATRRPTVGIDPVRVPIFSQVALIAGLPFALIPLNIMTSRKSIMGDLVNRRITTATATITTIAVLALNGMLLAQA